MGIIEYNVTLKEIYDFLNSNEEILEIYSEIDRGTELLSIVFLIKGEKNGNFKR